MLGTHLVEETARKPPYLPACCYQAMLQTLKCMRALGDYGRAGPAGKCQRIEMSSRKRWAMKRPRKLHAMGFTQTRW